MWNLGMTFASQFFYWALVRYYNKFSSGRTNSGRDFYLLLLNYFLAWTFC